MDAISIFMMVAELIIPVIIVVAGIWMDKRPPKEINNVKGYRTRRSQSSQEAWDFAQHYSGRLLTYVGIALLVITAFLQIPILNGNVLKVSLFGCLVLIGQCIVLCLTIIPTEAALKKKFNV